MVSITGALKKDKEENSAIPVRNISDIDEMNPIVEHSNPKALIIVGNGPVGVHFVRELKRQGYKGKIKIFGNEPWYPYNRVQLSLLLSGDVNVEQLQTPLTDNEGDQFMQFHNCAVERIDRDNQCVIDQLGNSHPYEKLILAVGSRPHIPSVDGRNLKGVFTFRDLKDAEKLIARRVSSRHTVVVGGGLLGIEAAKAMLRLNTKVTIVQQSPRLMNRQLDDEAAKLLSENLSSLGVEIKAGSGLGAIEPHHLRTDTAGFVVLRNGERLPCDTVIFATGISPNIDLSRNAWVKVNRGIVVNEHLQTSDENIYAIGECAEFNGHIYGLVAPGFEQASVLASFLCGSKVTYKGSVLAPKLKVVGLDVFSMGEVGEELDAWGDTHAVTHHPVKNGAVEEDGDACYRKIFITKGKLTGAVSVGTWAEIPRLQEAIISGKRIWPWQRWRFKKTGFLWNDDEFANVSQWPASAVVCNCKAVSKGTLMQAFENGCDTVQALSCQTGASSVCGSCKPLLADLVGDTQVNEKANKYIALFVVSILTLLLGVAYSLLPPIPYLETAVNGLDYDDLWRDGFIKQVSGFSILGITIFALILSLRKRIAKLNFGQFTSWRFVHVMLGLLLVTTLLAHTGARFGEQLNFYLMLNFVTILLVGAVTGWMAAMETKSAKSRSIKVLKRWIGATHIYVIWPLPVLLCFHVVSVYFF